MLTITHGHSGGTITVGDHQYYYGNGNSGYTITTGDEGDTQLVCSDICTTMVRDVYVMLRYELVDRTGHSLSNNVNTRLKRYNCDALAYIHANGKCSVLWGITQIRDCHEVIIQNLKLSYCYDLDKQLWITLDEATVVVTITAVMERMSHVDLEIVTPLQHRDTSILEYLDEPHPSSTPRGRPYRRQSGELIIGDRLVHYRYYRPVTKVVKSGCLCNIGP